MQPVSRIAIVAAVCGLSFLSQPAGARAQQTPPSDPKAKPAQQAGSGLVVGQPGQPATPGQTGQPPRPLPPPAVPNEPPSVGREGSVTGPGFVVDTPTFNFGKAASGTDIVHDFWFTNPGTEKLVIEAVRPSCGCTTTGSWDREVLPGGSGRIPIKVATKNFGGRISKVVNITTNAPAARAVQLKVEGEIWQPVQVTPPHLSFGRLMGEDLNKPKTQEFSIKNNTQKPLAITETAITSEVFKVEPGDRGPIEPGKELKMKVTANPPFTSGNLTTQLKLKTNSAEAPEVNMVLSAYVPAAVQLVPQRMQLPIAVPENYEQAVRIQNNAGKPIKISNIKCSDDKIKVALSEPMVDKSYDLKIAVPAGFKAPPAGVTVSMETDDPTAKNLMLYVTQLSTGAMAQVPIRPTSPSVKPMTPTTPAKTAAPAKPAVPATPASPVKPAGK